MQAEAGFMAGLVSGSAEAGSDCLEVVFHRARFLPLVPVRSDPKAHSAAVRSLARQSIPTLAIPTGSCQHAARSGATSSDSDAGFSTTLS